MWGACASEVSEVIYPNHYFDDNDDDNDNDNWNKVLSEISNAILTILFHNSSVELSYWMPINKTLYFDHSDHDLVVIYLVLTVTNLWGCDEN